ncbi:hypothetical protein [Microbacterium sp. Root553]|uniref:hypothetical protein n=1 Tax=Microbacterium sp. Root553 TaxID=1736556 RepID=UPI000A4F6FF4
MSKAARQFLNERVNDRLKTALGVSGITHTQAPAAATSAEVVEADLDRDTEIETSLEELEGYQIVKAIACGEVKPQRVTHRDAKSYFAVLLDDDNRKPVARLHFKAIRSTSVCSTRRRSRRGIRSRNSTRSTRIQTR